LTSLPADLHPRVHSRARRPLGRSVPDDRSRSVFAVSHRPDGFLLHGWCGLVASRCRTEGSPRFPLLHGAIRKPLRNLAFPATPFTPPEGPPSSAAVPRHRGPCPPAVIIHSVRSARSSSCADHRGDRSLPAARDPEGPRPRCGQVMANHPFAVGPARCRRQPRLPTCVPGVRPPCGVRSSALPRQGDTPASGLVDTPARPRPEGRIRLDVSGPSRVAGCPGTKVPASAPTANPTFPSRVAARGDRPILAGVHPEGWP
jgi:hypothetical protein